MAKENNNGVVVAQPLYDGRDHHLSETSFCAACRTRKTQEQKLLVCSGCQLVHYCNAECQKKHYVETHKTVCKDITRLKKLTDREGRALKRFVRNNGRGKPQNLFETRVGDFLALDEASAYMKSRNEFVESMYRFAYEVETKHSWEKALFHYLEISRLCHRDDLNLRYRIPFILLYLNRDDDACDFCLYYIKRDRYGQRPERDRIHENTQEGDWIYPHVPNGRYVDPLEGLRESVLETLPLSYLVALCVIKMRMVAAYFARKIGVALFARTTFGEMIEQSEAAPVVSRISEMLVGGDQEVQRIDSIRQQIERILERIHTNNPSILPAIINPEPLKGQSPPPYFRPRGPSEAYYVLFDCNRCWLRVPGAEQRLVSRFGKEPIFNTNLAG
jgi:hypothetical protein